MSQNINSLNELLSPEVIQTMSRQLNIDPSQASSAISLILPVLTEGLSRNAQSPQGAQSLQNALQNDHDGSILNQLPEFIQNFSSGPGLGILKHILGPQQAQIAGGVSQQTGISSQQTMQLMMMLAPMIMGFLGKKQQTTTQSGGGGILDILNQVQQQAAPQQSGNPSLDLLKQMLDKNGDGNVQQEVMDLGKKILGGLFGK